MWVALSDKCHSCRTFGDLETKITNTTAYKGKYNLPFSADTNCGGNVRHRIDRWVETKHLESKKIYTHGLEN